ncbi:ATP-dependent helicase [Candidatus Saccharibacteria bacterium]|nr:ATP-dependent helicase [Candidatus Saccharibacteria bacterium]
MESFETIYTQLNSAQKKAVDTLYGPVLVLAGPGTGKTQLLGARVAQILRKTDVAPQNILCLTFTENGALNMRQRLSSFIGQAAYDVTIGTYHAFGSAIINQYPEYFSETRLERPIDDLVKYELVRDIIEATDYRSPIKQTRHHLGDLIATMSEVKRGLLSPAMLRDIADNNIATIAQTKSAVAAATAAFSSRMSSRYSVATAAFDEVLAILHAQPVSSHPTNIAPYAALAADELERALALAAEQTSTKPLTAWKNAWLVKDTDNQFLLAGGLESARLRALASVLEQYQAALEKRGLYDFDDMILRTIHALEKHDNLRYTLQEKYQFILLDEFQDTNAAQLRLVELLTSNPVDEGRPNVLAVGDDDQAIYAFQGAQYSNMLDFFQLYRDVAVITLTENYRSTTDILTTASNVSAQIESRLHQHFPGTTKQLVAKNASLPVGTITRRRYKSVVAERAAIANEVKYLIGQGVNPSEIAVLSPRHHHLEGLVPYLQNYDIPVSYEKRENVLETPIVKQLLTMAKLVLALSRNQAHVSSSLWVEVLSYDFWQFPTEAIWKLSWQANDNHKSWSEKVIETPLFRHAGLLFLTLAGKVASENLETIIDRLIGTADVQTNDSLLPSVRSPLYDFYFKNSGNVVLYEAVTQLTVLRSKLREYQANQTITMHLEDLINFVAAYEIAEQPMLNTSPYNQHDNAVQLMTVYKAKGLEFEHVFLLSCDDTTWGSKATGKGNKLTLPANVRSIRHAGTTDDEKLRLLFVALTRAKYGLYLTSHDLTYSGKTTEPVKYFNEVATDTTGTIALLPSKFQEIIMSSEQAPELSLLALNWQQKHLRLDTTLKQLLSERLQSFQLSPTHLTHLLDLKYGGPESFVLNTLLRFPSAPSQDSSFGNALHETMQWLQNQLNITGFAPSLAEAITYATTYLRKEPLEAQQKTIQEARAANALESIYAQIVPDMRSGNIAEKSFKHENVHLGPAHLGGKIDLLEIDEPSKTIVVIDYKTGQQGSDAAKLRRYQIQLYCYKLLVERSRTYKAYRVTHGQLMFIEPDSNGRIQRLTVTFTDKEQAHIEALLKASWACVQALAFPTINDLGDSLKDMKTFESRLLGSE